MVVVLGMRCQSDLQHRINANRWRHPGAGCRCLDLGIVGIGEMSKKHFVIRIEQTDNRAYICQQIMQGLEGEIVRISDPTRTLAQNALIHAVLTEAGDLIGWKFSGQAVDLDDLKSIFMAAYRKASGVDTRFVMGIDGQPVILNWRTRDMTKRECSEFTEMIYAWMEEFKRGMMQ